MRGAQGETGTRMAEDDAVGLVEFTLVFKGLDGYVGQIDNARIVYYGRVKGLFCIFLPF